MQEMQGNYIKNNMANPNNLKNKYLKEVIPVLAKKFGYKNKMAVPKIEKVTINIGINQNRKDQQYLDLMASTLERITGQKPVETKAKKSISSFKIRQGMTVGLMLTLRGKRMYNFLDKLVNITLPRVRDFRGLPLGAVDNSGNLNIGFKEHIAFPEIKSDEIERLHGLQVNVTTSASTQKEGLELFKLLGFPIK